MQSLTCPIPDNINPLQSNGFLFSIQKLPEIAFFCQEVILPNISLPFAEMSTRLVNTKLAGDKVQYDDLTITFLIDENMNNFVAIHDWLIGMGFPQSTNQFEQFIRNRSDDLNKNVSTATSSDGVLQILNSNNRPSRTIRFTDLIPTQLSSLTLQSTTSDTQYLAGNATFSYTLYQFE